MTVWSYSKDKGLELEKTIKAIIFDCDGTLVDSVNWCAIDEIVAIAKQYHGKLPLAVASGGSREDVIWILNTFKISNLFEPIVTIDDLPEPNMKPSPDLFLHALREIDPQIQPHECLVFEDSISGFRAAEAAKMHLIKVQDIFAYHDK